MHTRYFALACIALFSLVGCGKPASPIAENQVQSSSSAESAPDLFDRLSSLPLPAEWAHADMNDGTFTFALPSGAAALRNAAADEDFFRVRPLLYGHCDRAYADMKVAEQAGDTARFALSPLLIDGSAAGYTWFAFDGVAGDAVEPENRHWCIRHQASGMDLDITALRADTQTGNFIENTFIPLWLSQTL